MIFDSDFILYLKEENKEQPYFALKVDNTEVLVADETRVEVEEDNEEENEITENTTTNTTTSQNNNRNNNTAVRQNNTSNSNNTSSNSNRNNNREQQTSTETRTETGTEVNTTANSDDIVTFEGTIKNIMNEECVSIVPDKEDPKITSKSVLIRYQENKGYEVGKKVKVTFKGEVTKSYPQNVNLVSIEILN